MRLIVPNEADKKRWDELVSSHNGLIFSKSWYLDATGFEWKLLIHDDFSGGMACPYVVKMGQEILVTPFFVRCVQWLGQTVGHRDILPILQKNFTVADLQVELQGLDPIKKHQLLSQEDYKLGSQAKRSLKKAEIFQVNWALDIEVLQKLIQQELKDKIHGITDVSLAKLSQLVQSAPEGCLLQINCWQDNHFKGGLWLLEDENRVIYLKGSSDAEGKKLGVMYRLMQEAIQYALEKGKIFDFGGSNVASVSNFNYNFGAKDAFYAQLTWNNAPGWWNFIRNLRNRWKKK